MNKPNPAILFGFLCAVLIVGVGVEVAKGVLLINRHEGDMYHLLQILFRMDMGQWPHKDFMTPIGILAFAPFELFVARGIGVGHAIIYGQALIGVALLPMVWWAAYSRLRGMVAYIFGLFVLVLAVALVHGEAQPAISISMHYNRWAWAFAYVAIVLAVLPSRGPARAWVDGGLIGVCLAALALLKMTYFVAFFPPVVLALMLHRAWRTLGVAALSGLVVVAVVTFFAGLDFWGAYLHDLLVVSASDIRANPGRSLGAVMASPAYLGGSLVALLGVVLLRQGGKSTGGVLLLFLVPGFFYVTYQNFGNDPQWLILLSVLLFSQRPRRSLVNGLGWNVRTAMNMAGAAALAFALPSFFNLAYSPFRHFNLDTKDYAPLLPGDARNADFRTRSQRAYQVDARVPMDGPGSGLEAYAPLAKRDDPAILNGAPLARCEVQVGLPAWFDGIASDLKKVPATKGKRIFVADLISGLWLFDHQLVPLKNGAPWYYGGLPGFASADYVLVPLCPILPKTRKEILDQIAARRDISLTEIRRTPLYVLLLINRG